MDSLVIGLENYLLSFGKLLRNSTFFQGCKVCFLKFIKNLWVADCILGFQKGI